MPHENITINTKPVPTLSGTEESRQSQDKKLVPQNTNLFCP
uniref:Uncharacterized protein n=1 Tax=Rhizophora mucronata TaxID=61149 RepID=A0A2P2PFK5_RHIMU